MNRALTGLLTLGSLLAWAPLASAQLEPAGVVTTLLGTASVARASLPQPAPLKFKDQVFVKDRITTGENSVARILLGGKAVVTVRERSVLTITELPRTSVIEVGSGKAALAVVKDRMKPGDSIEIRTPNAVAAIRGTVVITEVEQVSAQAGAAAPVPVVTRFVGLAGTFDVSQLVGGRRVGPVMNVTAAQSVQLAGAAAPRLQNLTRDAAQRYARDYQVRVPSAPPGGVTSAPMAAEQLQQASSYATNFVDRGPSGPAREGEPRGQGQQGPSGPGGPAAGGGSGPGPGGPGPGAPGPGGGASPGPSAPAAGAPGAGGVPGAGGGSGSSGGSRPGPGPIAGSAPVSVSRPVVIPPVVAPPSITPTGVTSSGSGRGGPSAPEIPTNTTIQKKIEEIHRGSSGKGNSGRN